MPRPLFLALLLPLAAPAAEVSFNHDIRPILNKNCISCHGGVKQAGEVSFLYRDDVLGKGESGKSVVVPGDPAASELIRRVRHRDPDEKMPPPEEHPGGLSDKQITLLEDWIRQGAKWGEHWAFQKPTDPPLPAVKHAAWPKLPLDHFVLARIEAENLTTSSPAGPAEWLRRASLDLTGMPPSIADLEAFLQAAAADPQAAMETAADRLLASPAFGERWAAMWLDLARYSDTTGFEKDPHRDIWPFRDWVIRAFNSDLPFDQFTVKQLAGDLLESPEPGDSIATAYHRNTQNNTEGGTDDEEYRIAAVIDRVNNTWTTWQATTFGCVQCHAHPYDPFPQEDYYRFTAFFNNTEDADLNDEFPRIKVANDPARQADASRLEKEIRRTRESINREALTTATAITNWSLPKLASAASNAATGQLAQLTDGTILASGTNPTGAVYTISAPVEDFAALKLEILPDHHDPKQWSGLGSVVSKLEATLVRADGSRQPVPFREVVADFLAGPFDPMEAIRDGVPGFGDYPMTRGPRTAFFAPEQSVPTAPDDRLEIVIRHGAVCNGENQSCVLRRFRVSFSSDARLTEFLATPARAAAWQQLHALQQQFNAIPGVMIPGMVERPDPARRETRVFIRGNRLTKDQAVAAGLPKVLAPEVGPDAPATPMSRLDMARWLVAADNPLTARVLANRLWAELFGHGIVETLEDFGSSGTPPTHPELLDHLALRLANHHRWHIKPFLRELVLSATYRQSNKTTPALLAKDPRNLLLARGPRVRLTAEMVRDQALAVSGLLSSKQFGPPVFPPQPEGVWKTVYSGATWNTSQGEDRYRRAVYTYQRRTSGYPAFLTFDAPTRDICTARRVPTNTPLQALVTLNDPAHIEFAQALAQRMAEAGPGLTEALDRGHRLVTQHPASPATIATLAKLHAEALTELNQTPAESTKLAPTPNQAALVLVANTLLNSDSALNR